MNEKNLADVLMKELREKRNQFEEEWGAKLEEIVAQHLRSRGYIRVTAGDYSKHYVRYSDTLTLEQQITWLSTKMQDSAYKVFCFDFAIHYLRYHCGLDVSEIYGEYGNSEPAKGFSIRLSLE